MVSANIMLGQTLGWKTGVLKTLTPRTWTPNDLHGLPYGPVHWRGIEWSLQACEHCVSFCEHEQCLNSPCEKPALKKDVTGEQWALRKFSANSNPFLILHVFIAVHLEVLLGPQECPILLTPYRNLTNHSIYFCTKKPTKNNLRSFKQSSKFQRESEHASTCKYFASTSKRALV